MASIRRRPQAGTNASFTILTSLQWLPDLPDKMLVELQGLCKNIGVSNFGIGHLEQLLQYATVLPAVNQIELSPFLQRKELVDYCRSKDIALEVTEAALIWTECLCSNMLHWPVACRHHVHQGVAATCCIALLLIDIRSIKVSISICKKRSLTSFT